MLIISSLLASKIYCIVGIVSWTLVVIWRLVVTIAHILSPILWHPISLCWHCNRMRMSLSRVCWGWIEILLNVITVIVLSVTTTVIHFSTRIQTLCALSFEIGPQSYFREESRDNLLLFLYMYARSLLLSSSERRRIVSICVSWMVSMG